MDQFADDKLIRYRSQFIIWRNTSNNTYNLYNSSFVVKHGAYTCKIKNYKA